MDIQELAGTIEVQGEYSLEGIDFITSGDQYLMFELGEEKYAVDILCVEEIRSWENPTKIPNSPDYVKGVINMRGVIVPILDLRMQFAVGKPTYSETTVVIVLTAEKSGRKKTIGYVVDAVSEVLNAEESEIKPAPAFGGNIPQEYITGLVNLNKDVVTFLDVEMLQTLEPHNC